MCPRLTSVTIPNSVATIGNSAFESCSNLNSVTIGTNVTSMGQGTFAYCTSLTNLTILDGASSIGEFAFEGCTNLTNITLPASVTTIGVGAFAICTSLTGIYFQGNAPSLIGGTILFNGDNNTTVYYLPGTTGWSSPFGGRPVVPLYFTFLQVSISPPSAVTAGAQWQVDSGAWHNCGVIVSNLAAGIHTVSFSTIGGWTTPTNQAVTVMSNQTTTVTGTYVQQFGNLQVVLAPAGVVSEGAQWQVDSGAWQNSGVTVSGLAVGSHTVAFLMVPGWGVPASQIVTVNFNQTTIGMAAYLAPQPATATAIMTNGFVVAAMITDAGIGYTNTPLVYLVGGGGSGAQAVATVSNGVLTGITIINAGSGYTNTPIVAITPPFPLTLGIAPATSLGFTNLIVGTNYQLQVSQSGTWNNLGSSFIAGASTCWQYLDGRSNGSSYQLVGLPLPYGATATAILAYDFVVAAAVTDGGCGYVSVPSVVIVGGGGSGAQATATVSNGVVMAVNIISAGFGYTDTPTIQIDPPPVPALLPNITPAFRLDCSGLAPALTYQLQASPDLAGWTSFGVAFAATANTNSQYLNSRTGSQFFRLSLP
jgi:hypothetical protein